MSASASASELVGLRQYDVGGIPLRMGDFVVISGIHKCRGVVGRYSGAHRSAFGDLAKVFIVCRAPASSPKDVERPVVPPACLRVLQHHERRLLLIDALKPRTLHASQLADLGLTQGVAPGTANVTYGHWTPGPALPRKLPSQEEIDADIARLTDRLSSASLEPHTVRSL